MDEQIKVLTIVVVEDDNKKKQKNTGGINESSSSSLLSFDLALIEGCEPAALLSAIKQRLLSLDDNIAGCIDCNSFYLTLKADPFSVVMPLTVSLPEGTKLYLHLKKGRSTMTVGDHHHQQQQQQQISTNDEADKDEIRKEEERGGQGFEVKDNNNNNNRGNQYEMVSRSELDGGPAREEGKEEETKKEGGDEAGDEKKITERKKWGYHAPIYNPFTTLANSVGLGTKKNEMFTGLYMFNQLGTDLANERTLLAWIRTLLACIRTLFAYEKLELDSPGEATQLAATLMLATLLLMAGFNAGYRYYTTRRMLMRSEKPKSYNKFSLLPFTLLATAIALLTSIETYRGRWDTE